MDELIPWFHQLLNSVEAKAKAATRGPWRVVNTTDYGSATVDGPDAMQDGGHDPETGGRRQVMRPLVVIPQDCDYGPTVELVDAEHIAFHNPERVLRRVEAHRRILADFEDLDKRIKDDGGYDTDQYTHDALADVVRLLAAEYADQPGYQDEWRWRP